MTHAVQSKSKKLNPWSLFFHQCTTASTTVTTTTTITVNNATTSTDDTADRCYVFFLKIRKTPTHVISVHA